jgi:multiple sugar transport system substrate-binding protein
VQQAGPQWKVYVNQTLFAHPRTLGLGVKYPKISQAVWTAIQAALSGSKSVQDALSTAQTQINTILKS